MLFFCIGFINVGREVRTGIRSSYQPPEVQFSARAEQARGLADPSKLTPEQLKEAHAADMFLMKMRGPNSEACYIGHAGQFSDKIRELYGSLNNVCWIALMLAATGFMLAMPAERTRIFKFHLFHLIHH